jgi:tRNA(Ile)-lysidine synthase
MYDFEQFLRHAWPPTDWADLTVLVAVSGGPDSVALLHGLARVRQPGRGRLVVAHFNHALRPDAELDEAFVRELAASLGLPCVVGRPAARGALPTAPGPVVELSRPTGFVSNPQRQQQALATPPAAATGQPPPAAAGCRVRQSEAFSRQARYAFLRQTAQSCGARFVVTAHTADDQVETILHRIVRGTGLTGLPGMPRARRLGDGLSLLRPLLDCPRRDILRYLAQRRLAYREDPTNHDRAYTRNRIRHALLPMLRSQFNPRVDEALWRLASQAREAQALIQHWAGSLAAQAATGSTDSIRLQASRLAGQPVHLVCEVLRHAWREQRWPQRAMHHRHWRQLAHMVLQGPPAGAARRPPLTLPSHVQCAWEDDQTLVLRRIPRP